MIPQYAKSTDPDVLAAIERNGETYHSWRERVADWAKQYSDTDTVMLSGFGRTTHVSGLGGKIPTGHGRWTRTYSGNGWRPFKNNPVHAEMKDLSYRAESIPGLPDTVDSIRDADWRHYMMTPHPFVYDGAAWLGFNHPPERGDHELGPQWVEIKTSEYYAAREAAFPKEAAS